MFARGNGCLVIADVVVDGQGQIENRKENENPGDNRIAWDFVSARSIRFFAAKDEYTISASGIENPAYEDQGISEGIEGSAEQQKHAPEALNHKTRARS